MSALFFALSAFVAGAVQIGLLAASPGSWWRPLSLMLRLLIVAVVLFLAARAGHLAIGVGGWLLGFLLAAVITARRMG